MKLERDLHGEKGSRKGGIWLGSSKEEDSEVEELQGERKGRQEGWGQGEDQRADVMGAGESVLGYGASPIPNLGGVPGRDTRNSQVTPP